MNFTGDIVANGSDVAAGVNIVNSSGNGTATVLLSGNNTYAGGTTVNAGALLIASQAGSLGIGPVTLKGGVLRVTPGAFTVSGFGATGSGWTANTTNIVNPPFPALNVLQLTDGGNSEARSAFFNTPVPIISGGAGFTASFIYQDADQGTADGVVFVPCPTG